MNNIKKQTEIQMTKETLRKLKKELRERKRRTRKEIAKEIGIAADFGDRSENAAYSVAIEKRNTNESRIVELAEMISNAIIMKKDKGNKDRVVSLGDKVALKINGKTEEYEIVSAGEGDLSHGQLPTDSPIGMAITGKRKGEKATVDAPIGNLEITIVDVK